MVDGRFHISVDPDTGVCTTPCLMIIRLTGKPEAPICYHGFGGDGTATVYTDPERAEQVLRTLNPEQGWIIQRQVLVSRVAVKE